MRERSRRMSGLFLALFLTSGVLLAGSRSACVAGPTTLCLNGGRFRAEVQWTDFQGTTGVGQAVTLTGDTGYFWFFSASNVELVVKVLDGRVLNSSFWVFYGALSNVQYTMTVTDTLTGAVKTYVNPSGQFGSVGDTAAFPAGKAARSAVYSPAAVEALSRSAELALRESLLTAAAGAPKRSAAAPTCEATATSLCLNAGRFRVEVAWTDFAGKTGVGTAVGLTGDTGYFWFFSSNNVELTVKALDARALNGRFWVFYGALTNVQYEMRVTDTLTGVVNTYANPSGRFASAGDTEGFRAGYAVAAQLDDSRAATAVIPTTGGTLSTTAADGTVFTLTVPDKALLSEAEITMTPVASVGGLPLGGGLTAAVQLAPEGLLLFEAATLVIAPPAAVPIDSEITFAWRGGGEEFFLTLRAPTADAPVTLDVFRLSGYGVGRGTPADQTAQQAHPPGSLGDQLEQELQASAEEERRTLRNGGTLGTGGAKRASALRPSSKTPAQAAATASLNRYFLAVISPKQPTTCGAEWIGFLQDLRSFAAKVRRLTGPDATLTAAVLAYFDSLYTLETGCYDQAYDRCVANRNPAEGEKMAQLYFALINHAPFITVDRSKIGKCLTFELKFDSTVIEPPIPNDQGAIVILKHKVGAVVTGISVSNDSATDAENLSAHLTYTPTSTFAPGSSRCTFSETGADSTFHLVKASLELNFYGPENGPSTVLPLRLTYEPGEPIHSFTLTCDGVPATLTSARWREYYGAFHFPEFHDGNFVLGGWTKTGGGDPYATRHFAQAGETTDFVLKHTPR